jgi:hypothetical protein
MSAGAIQIIRDTLEGSRQCHQITQGGGRGSTKVSRDIFWPCCELRKMKNVTALGEGQYCQMTHWEGREVKNRPKKCHLLFEWPRGSYCMMYRPR